MPNRVLRDWTASDKIDSIDIATERFFTRLIMKADDYGRYSAKPQLLKSHLFPLKNDIKESDIVKWLSVCESVGIIKLYSVAEKAYLQIIDFRQVLRQKVEKYPAPDACGASAMQMTSISSASASLKRKEKKQNTKPDTEGAKAQRATEELEIFRKFDEFVDSHAPRVKLLKQPFTIDQVLKIKKEFSAAVVKTVLLAMQNRADLLKKYESANLTFRNWAARELKNSDVTLASAATGDALSAAIKKIEDGIK